MSDIYSPTPWSVDGADPDTGVVKIGDADGYQIAKMLQHFRGPDDAARTIACVNACVGLHDPAKLPVLVALLRHVKDDMDSHHHARQLAKLALHTLGASS